MVARIDGAYQITAALQQHGEDMAAEVNAEMARLAGSAVRIMQRLAPKHQSLLRNSVAATQTGEFEHEIGPTAAYAGAVEEGVRPGGKGLPRFFDPASKSMVDWLESHPRGGGVRRAAKPRKGSKVFTAVMLALRDRYEGLAWHVRHKGVQAQPFVAPTAAALEPEMLARLDAAVRRVLAARPEDSGGALA